MKNGVFILTVFCLITGKGLLFHGISFASLEQKALLSSYIEIYNDLIRDNNDPVDIYELHVRQNRLNQSFPNTKRWGEKRWGSGKAQVSWNAFSEVMRGYDSMDVDMWRLAERIVFASYAMRCFDGGTYAIDYLTRFCAAFTYCVQRRTISSNDQDFIAAVKNHTCQHQVAARPPEPFEHELVTYQVPYIASITCRLDEKAQDLSEREKTLGWKENIELLERAIFGIFFESEAYNQSYRQLYIKDCESQIEKIGNLGACSDFEARIEDMRKLKELLERKLKDPSEFFDFYENFERQFKSESEKQAEKMKLELTRKIDEMHEEYKQELQREELRKKRREQLNFYLRMLLLGGSLAAFLFWIHKHRSIQLPSDSR